MEPSEKEKVLALYPEFDNVYGPYLRKDGRMIVVLYDGQKRSARQLAKVRLEVQLGRRLVDDETVDHKDEVVSNDAPDNLAVLSRVDNAKKSAVRREETQVACDECGCLFTLSRNQTTERAKASPGCYCSRSCSGKANQRRK